jgi:hypothetical protein
MKGKEGIQKERNIKRKEYGKGARRDIQEGRIMRRKEYEKKRIREGRNVDLYMSS